MYKEFLMKFIDDINTMLCPIIINSNTIELTVHTSWYCVLDLLCVTWILSRSERSLIRLYAAKVFASWKHNFLFLVGCVVVKAEMIYNLRMSWVNSQCFYEWLLLLSLLRLDWHLCFGFRRPKKMWLQFALIYFNFVF